MIPSPIAGAAAGMLCNEHVTGKPAIEPVPGRH